MRGGYQIIDLKNKNITTDVGMVYEGIYDIMEGTRKPIMVTGMQVDEKEYRDAIVDFTLVGSAYIGEIHGKVMKVEDTDVVTFATSVGAGECSDDGDGPEL